MQNLLKSCALSLACLAPAVSLAADYDGSKNLICATVEARDCELRAECFTGEAKVVGAPAFFRIDFSKKVLLGPERNSPIVSLEHNADSFLLQGAEIGYGWTIGIDKESGDFSASMTNFEGSFLLFGYCTVM